MKKNTVNIIIALIAALFLITIILIDAFSGGNTEDGPSAVTGTSAAEVSVADILTEVPDDTETGVIDETGESTETVNTVIADETVTVPDPENILTIPDETEPFETEEAVTREHAAMPAVPVTEKTPSDDGNVTSGGIIIDGGQPETYDCGYPGHRCDGPETHAFIVNLELDGCPYCGKHDCPSFYALDEWGHTCYAPVKCPKYDVKNDPVYYCQSCKRQCGDGTGGTCVQFVSACNCPICGEWVESWTCHTCK